MKETIVSVVFFALALFPSLRETAAADGTERHLDATHCEVFIDRIGISSDATRYDTRWVHVYLKILPERLDGRIVEVGARSQQTTTHAYGVSVDRWRNLMSYPVSGNTAYVEIPFQVAGRHYTIGKYNNRSDYETAYYAKTDRGTYYWAKGAGGRNLSIDENLYKSIGAPMGFNEFTHPGYAPLKHSVPAVQLGDYNVFSCQ